MSSEFNIEQYDEYIKSVDWLKDTDLPLAITLTEILEPSEGKDAIIFPPTYAVSKTASHPYQIDILEDNLSLQQAAQAGFEKNTCLIDSIGSQANRMESVFKQMPLSELVPQITIKLNDTVSANLLDVGHRIADGAVRFSGLRFNVTKAIEALKDHANALPLAKLAPTSLIFGFWDSRPETTLYKFGRMLSSTIRATNVAIVKRSAQFNPAFDPTLLGLEDEISTDEIEAHESSGKAADGKDPLSKLGLRSAPAVNTHGGVRVFGQIVRRTQINLVRLRALGATENGKINTIETLKLRRYLLGLSLVAARVQTNYDLREGCLLCCQESTSQLIYPTGRKGNFEWNKQYIYNYVKNVTTDFGIGEDKIVDFDDKAVKAGLEKVKQVKPSKTKK